MKTAIIGKKVGMTQIFDEAGKVVPVTVIEAGPCTVTYKATEEKEGYNAVQLGYEDVAEKKLSKPEKGHFDKAGVGYKKHLKEFRLEDTSALNVGDVLKADVFKEGDKVDVTGISKGKGYAGVVKRFGQGRTPTTHGGGPVHRHAGSMGSSTDPSRILRHRLRQEHRQEGHRQEGRRRCLRQPAEGFGPQPAEGFRQKVRKGERINAYRKTVQHGCREHRRGYALRCCFRGGAEPVRAA